MFLETDICGYAWSNSIIEEASSLNLAYFQIAPSKEHRWDFLANEMIHVQLHVVSDFIHVLSPPSSPSSPKQSSIMCHNEHPTAAILCTLSVHGTSMPFCSSIFVERSGVKRFPRVSELLIPLFHCPDPDTIRSGKRPVPLHYPFGVVTAKWKVGLLPRRANSLNPK